MTPLSRLLRQPLAFAAYIGRRLLRDNCQRSAAALTYMSLFAIVPLMTVTFALFSAIPAFDTVGEKIRSLVFAYFVPAAGAHVEQYLQQFTAQAQNLTAAGFAFLAVTAFLMLRNIEKAFNEIWNTRGNRRGLSGFLLYWAVLSLGPLLLGIGFIASTYLLSFTVLAGQADPIGIAPQLLDALPLLTEIAAFTLLYFAVPNCPVPIRHALLGGTLTALVFEGAKTLFGLLVSNTSYELVYGTFAAVPLFLLWIYLSWLLLLAGAEFVRALSSFGDSHSEQPDLLVALALLALFREQHRSGHPLDEATLLARRWKPGGRPITRERWESVRNRLLGLGVIAATDDNAFVLSRDLGTLSLAGLAAAFGGIDAPLPAPDSTAAPWLRQAHALLSAEAQRRQQALAIPVDTLYGDCA